MCGAEQHISSGSARAPSKLGAIGRGKKHVPTQNVWRGARVGICNRPMTVW